MSAQSFSCGSDRAASPVTWEPGRRQRRPLGQQLLPGAPDPAFPRTPTPFAPQCCWGQGLLQVRPCFLVPCFLSPWWASFWSLGMSVGERQTDGDQEMIPRGARAPDTEAGRTPDAVQRQANSEGIRPETDREKDEGKCLGHWSHRDVGKRNWREVDAGAGQREPGCGDQAGKVAGGLEAQNRTAEENMEKTGRPRWRLGNPGNQVRKYKCRTERQTEGQTKRCRQRQIDTDRET